MRHCEHDEDPRGVSAWQHAHGQRCYWCWLDDGAPMPDRIERVIDDLSRCRACERKRFAKGLCMRCYMRDRRATSRATA